MPIIMGILLKRPIAARRDKTLHITSPLVGIYEKIGPNQYSLVKSQPLKQKCSVWNLFKVNIRQCFLLFFLVLLTSGVLIVSF